MRIWLLWASLCWSATALAELPRVCLLVEEQHDGARAEAGGGEAELARGLIEAGFPLVERYESEQARSRVSIERLLRGETAGLEVSGLHADLLVAVRLTVKSEQAPYGITYPVHNARLDLRVLTVDTGRVLSADSTQGASPGDAAQAAAKAARAALPKLLTALKSVPESAAGGVVELRVAGLKESGAADRLAQALSHRAGVKSARLRFVSADATVIDLTGVDAARLAALLSSLHLAVTRRSANAVEARLEDSRPRVQVAPFVNRTGKPDLDWLQSLLAEVIETELANSKYLAPIPGRPTIDPDRPQLGAVAAELVIVGKIERAGATLRLSARALRKSDGAVLAAAQLFGAEAQAAELGKELAGKLDEPLYLKLQGKSSLEAYIAVRPRAAAATATATPPPGEGARVRVDDIKLDDLFPARLGHYASRPLGRVFLRNDGRVPADDVRLEVSLGELSGGVQTLRVPTLAPGARVEVPITLVLERHKLLEVTQRRPARFDLTLVAGERRESFTEPVVLWDRNALDWGEPDSVAAFVTPKDPVVVAFAAEAEHLAPSSLPPSLRAAVGLFDAMVALGVRYQRDPLSPYGEKAVDTVQFPRETLARKLGDCDDLAVLYAALVQAAGRGARLVLTPGHVFVAVDSELSTGEVGRLGGASRVVVEGDRVWIPVEVTKLDGGFAGAWDAGLAEIGRFAGKVSYVDIGRAWTLWPPFPLDAPATPPPIDVQVAQKLLLADAGRLGARAGSSTPLPTGDAPPARLQRALAQARRGQNDDARRELERLAGDSANNRGLRAAAYNGLGNLDTLRGSYDGAVADYRHALTEGARADAVENNLGVAFYLAGRGSDARAHLLRGTSESKRLVKRLGLASDDTSDARQGLRGAAGETRLDPAASLIWIGD